MDEWLVEVYPRDLFQPLHHHSFAQYKHTAKVNVTTDIYGYCQTNRKPVVSGGRCGHLNQQGKNDRCSGGFREM